MSESAKPEDLAREERIATLNQDVDRLRTEVAALQATIVQTRELLDLANRTRALIESAPVPDQARRPDNAGQAIESVDEAVQTQSPAVRGAIDQSLGDQWRRIRQALLTQAIRPEWEPRHRWFWDATAVVIILVVAGLARYWSLSTIPLGMQGDEAAAGLEARRIMHQGWIGIFSPAASGNPTAFFYLTVPTVWAFGNDVISVRLTSATIDMLTILSFYVLLRRNLGFLTAVIGSSMLAVSAWHIHFARIAFMNILWPLLVVLSLIAFCEADRQGPRWWWAISGGFMAAGIYAYNGHFLFLGIAGAWLLLYFFGWQAVILGGVLASLFVNPDNVTAIAAAACAIIFVTSKPARNLSRWIDAGLFAAGFAIVFAAMAKLMITDTDRYFGRGRKVSLFNSDQWNDLDSMSAKASLLGHRYLDFWQYLADHPNLDYIAGSGSAAIVPVTAVALAVVGAILGLARRNHPLIHLSILTCLLMPFASVTTIDFGLRRAMIMAPFLALLAAIAVVEILRISRKRTPVIRYGAAVLAVLLLVQIGYANLHGFFQVNAKSNTMHWVLGQELVESAEFMNSLPDDAYVYFFSARWPFTHENIRYLASRAEGETRGEPYGTDSVDFDLSKPAPVVMLLGDFQDRLPEIEALYPGGEVVVSDYQYRESDRPAFIAYLLPPTPAQTP